MNHPIDARILVLARRLETAHQWSTALAGEGRQIWLDGRDVPQDIVPDVVLTDFSTPLAQLFELSRGTSGDRWTIGVIRVGVPGEPSCDVWLSAEPSRGELRVACRLLAEVVRLRRREEAASQIQDHLRQKALSDPLTGLPNRRAWDEMLAHRHAALRRGGPIARLCVAVADLDRFKHVNDTQGHDVGDRVLAAAGESLGASMRQADFVARLGGDEFGLLLGVPGTATAAMVLDRVRQRLPIQVEQATGLWITTSIGWRLASPEDEAPESILTLADAALREAKRAGRNCTRGSGGGA